MSQGLSEFEQGELVAKVDAIAKMVTELRGASQEQGREIADLKSAVSLVTVEIATGKKAAWVFFAAVGAILMKVGELLLGAIPGMGKS